MVRRKPHQGSSRCGLDPYPLLMIMCTTLALLEIRWTGCDPAECSAQRLTVPHMLMRTLIRPTISDVHLHSIFKGS